MGMHMYIQVYTYDLFCTCILSALIAVYRTVTFQRCIGVYATTIVAKMFVAKCCMIHNIRKTVDVIGRRRAVGMLQSVIPY